LDGGDWRGIEIALMPADVADDDAIDRAVQTVSDVGVHLHQLSITAEAPVAWPSGAFVRVDRLDDEARSGIERSAEFPARVRAFATVYPGLFAHPWDEELELGRYVEELGPHAEVAHVSDAHGLLGEGLPYGSGELELDPVVRRLGELVPFVVAEINEADPARSVEMKRAYRAIERALELPPVEPKPARRRVPTDSFDW